MYAQVEEKLFQNRYRVDSGRPHIEIVNPDLCREECAGKECTFVCPAACYRALNDGSVELVTDGCLECGSCRIICAEYNNIAWGHPRGGYGVAYKFG